MNTRIIGRAFVRGCVGVAVAVAALVACETSGGAAQNASSQGSPAIIGPLLQVLSFGDNVGLPLACEDGNSAVSAVEGQAGLSSEISPFVNEFETQCSNLSLQGENYLLQAEAESSALDTINPILDPGIAAMASGIQNVGNNYGSSFSPFGPTIAGLGGSIAFFEGS
jgi:hypothetical protein